MLGPFLNFSYHKVQKYYVLSLNKRATSFKT